jgi:hypothetical protein
VPLDVLLKYHMRLTASAAALPYSRALEWVTKRDEEERKLWTERFRSTKYSLGKVIQECFCARELLWDPANVPPPPRSEAPRPAKPTKPALGGPSAGGFADSLRDGTPVCRKWNQGKCEKSDCKFRHVCNAILRGGRVCGMSNHRSTECRRADRSGVKNDRVGAASGDSAAGSSTAPKK